MNRELKSLKYGPSKVGGSYGCSICDLSSLKGIPKIINNNLWCDNNKLNSLDSFPEYVSGGIWMRNNPVCDEVTLKDVQNRCIHRSNGLVIMK